MIDVREFKRGVESLSRIDEVVGGLQQHWLRPILGYSGSRGSVTIHLSFPGGEEVRKKANTLRLNLDELKKATVIHDKFKSYAKHLVDLKLAKIRGDHTATQFLARRLFKDEYLNVKKTLEEIKKFDENVKLLNSSYDQINELLIKELSLEEALFLMDLPHKKYLHSLLKTSQQHKAIVRDLTRHLSSLVDRHILGKERLR